MTRLKVWLNGKFLDADDARIPVSDRGFMYGDGVFETMRSYAGIVFKMKEHLDRLFMALRVMRIKPPYGKIRFREAINNCIKVNGLKSAYIRLSVTRGQGRFGLEYKDDFRPNCSLVVKEFGEYPEWMYSKGIRAMIASTRQNERSPLARIKSLNFLNYIIARIEAKERGFDDAILLNTKGDIAESVTANVFLAKRGVIVTPSLDSGALPGITRNTVIQIAKRLSLKVREKPVASGELSAADEVFLTNSLIEVLPVTRLGQRKIGSGRVGDVTKLLRISYQKEVIRETLLNRPFSSKEKA